QCGQSDRIKERFWNMLAIATLNEDPKVASAALLVRVLQEAFGGTKLDSCMGIAGVGLSDLYTAQARAIIEQRGGSVCLRAPVTRLRFEKSSCDGVELANGEMREADYYISALRYFAVSPMIP